MRHEIRYTQLTRVFNLSRRFLALSAVTLLALATVPAAAGAERSTAVTTWWIAADPHVGYRTETTAGENLAVAVEDVNRLDRADQAFMLGDLIEDCNDLTPEFIRLMNRLDIPWAYVLGNHDFDRRTLKPLLPPLYFARTVHGIRCLFLSDEESGRSNRNLVMSPSQEQWFREELEKHKDKPIFLFTHQPHFECEFWDWLRDRREDYRITAWFSGHKHNWNISRNSDHGFVQVNMHSIGGTRENHLSCFVDFEPREAGEDVLVTVRFRDHHASEWIAVDGMERLSFTVRADGN